MYLAFWQWRIYVVDNCRQLGNHLQPVKPKHFWIVIELSPHEKKIKIESMRLQLPAVHSLIVYTDFFVWGCFSHSGIFHSFGNVTITGDFTFLWHSWPLSNKGNLTCHTNCDRDLLFTVVISKDPCPSHLMQSVVSKAVTTCFNDFVLSRPEIEPRSPTCEASVLPLHHRNGALGW